MPAKPTAPPKVIPKRGSRHQCPPVQLGGEQTDHDPGEHMVDPAASMAISVNAVIGVLFIFILLAFALSSLIMTVASSFGVVSAAGERKQAFDKGSRR